MKYKLAPLAAMAFIVFLSGCQGNTAASPPKPDTPVKVAAAALGEISSTITYAGKISPAASLSVASKLSGKVEEIYFDIGDRVTEGDTLFRLDEEDIENQIKQLEASLQTAKTGVSTAQIGLASVTGGQYSSQLLQLQTQVDNYEKQLENSAVAIENAKTGLENAQDVFNNTKESFENIKILYEAGAASKADYDKAELGYNQARASLNAAQNACQQAEIGRSQIEIALNAAKETYDITTNQITGENVDKAKAGLSQAQSAQRSVEVQLEIARDTLKNTAVTAPISGIVSGKTAKAGEFTSPSVPAYTIVDITAARVDVKVSELVINKLHPGLEMEVFVNAVSDKPLSGTVLTVSPAADMTGMYPVTVEMENPDETLKPGMFAQVKVVREKSEGSIVLPRQAVLEDVADRYVYAAENGTAVKVPVITGIDNGEFIEILSGLNPGRHVIIQGQAFVTDGENVNVTEILEAEK